MAFEIKEDEWDAHKKDVHQIKNILSSFNTDLLRSIHESLVGNTINKDGGLVKRVERNENRIEEVCDQSEKSNKELTKRVDELEKRENKNDLYIKIMWTMAGTIAGIVLTLIARHFVMKM